MKKSSILPVRFSARLGKMLYIHIMNTQISKSRFAFYSILLVFLLSSTAAWSHDVVDVNGNPTHQHVYKNSGYGNGQIAGHAAKPAGSRGIVLWQAAPSKSYARPQSGMSIPRNPFSKKDPKRDAKKMYQQKPAFSKTRDRTPDLKPQ